MMCKFVRDSLTRAEPLFTLVRSRLRAVCYFTSRIRDTLQLLSGGSASNQSRLLAYAVVGELTTETEANPDEKSSGGNRESFASNRDKICFEARKSRGNCSSHLFSFFLP